VRIEKPFDSKEDVSTDPLFLDEKLILEESLDLVMMKLQDENRQKVFCSILQGHSPAEIAEEFGVSKRTIERFKNDIKEILTLEINQVFLKK
jgi:DNA-directed RNA polymerase specialized sigma24 family protein